MVQISGTVTVVAGDLVEFDEPLQVVEAFPSRPWCAEVFHAGEAGAEVVASLLPVDEDLIHHPAVTGFACLAVESSQSVDDGEVHFVAAGIEHASIGVEVGGGHEVGHAAAGVECLGVAGRVVPHHEGEHDVVVAPEVPVLEQAFFFRERAQVSIVGLAAKEFKDHCLDRSVQGIHRRPFV